MWLKTILKVPLLVPILAPLDIHKGTLTSPQQTISSMAGHQIDPDRLSNLYMGKL